MKRKKPKGGMMTRAEHTKAVLAAMNKHLMPVIRDAHRRGIRRIYLPPLG